MRSVGARLGRLLTIGSIPVCERCGGQMVVVKEERLATVVPIFEVLSRCAGCGHAATVRQVFELFD